MQSRIAFPALFRYTDSAKKQKFDRENNSAIQEE